MSLPNPLELLRSPLAAMSGRSMSGRLLSALLAVFAGMMLPATADAQTDFPTRPVHIIVPYPAGGIADKLAREVGEKLTERLKQSVVVENRSGAAGNIGFEYAARQPADGYTLVLAPASNLTVNTVLFKQLNYDLDKDFQPLSLLVTTPQLVLVPSSLPVSTLKELVAWSKANPGKISAAAGGIGSFSHLAAESLRSDYGADLNVIPYQGAAPALTDLVGGQVRVMFNEVITAAQYVKAGKLKALAIAAKTRAPWFPDVPTTAEAGFPGLEVVSWYGIVGRRGTPAPVIDRLTAELRDIMQTPDLKKRYDDIGAFTVGSSADEFARYMKSETDKWVPVVRRAGIQPQ